MDASALRILAFILVVLEMCALAWAELPRIVPARIPDVLEEGRRLLILCAVDKGSLPISFSWRKDNAPLVPGDDEKILHLDDYQEQLQIRRLNSDHFGNYTCAVRNVHGSDQITVPIVIKFAPRWILPTDEKPITAVLGESAVIDCSARGYPTPSVTLRKG